ncbi:MAG TPA: hypothetical protein ENI76_09160 [Ignavibacteria bacterium]|nr:hypothetical protein [Ignavibacteria bacterium]
MSGCENPFSPALDISSGSAGSVLSNLKTVQGVFKNFKYAYTFKDTTIYGKLISNNYVFTYHDYDQGYDVSWGRNEEMKTTYGLFQNVQRLDLIWNNVVLSTEDSLAATVIRGFNLTITFSPTDVIILNGRVNMSFRKNPLTQKWQITRWIDESNF